MVIHFLSKYSGRIFPLFKSRHYSLPGCIYLLSVWQSSIPLSPATSAFPDVLMIYLLFNMRWHIFKALNLLSDSWGMRIRPAPIESRSNQFSRVSQLSSLLPQAFPHHREFAWLFLSLWAKDFDFFPPTISMCLPCLQLSHWCAKLFLPHRHLSSAAICIRWINIWDCYLSLWSALSYQVRKYVSHLILARIWGMLLISNNVFHLCSCPSQHICFFIMNALVGFLVLRTMVKLGKF